MKHSPTPWKSALQADRQFERDWRYIFASDGRCIGFIDLWKDKRDEAEANVQFIVKAVNAYDAQQATIDALTKALEDALETMERTYLTDDDADDITHINTARAALNAARPSNKCNGCPHYPHERQCNRDLPGPTGICDCTAKGDTA